MISDNIIHFLQLFRNWNGGVSSDSGASVEYHRSSDDDLDFENHFNKNVPQVLHSLEYHVICKECKSTLFKYAERKFEQDENLWVFPIKVIQT